MRQHVNASESTRLVRTNHGRGEAPQQLTEVGVDGLRGMNAVGSSESVVGERDDVCAAMVGAVEHGLGEERMDSLKMGSNVTITMHRFRLVSWSGVADASKVNILRLRTDGVCRVCRGG